MAFGAVTNLASAEAADAERKRREQQAQLALESEGLKDELLGLKQAEAGADYSQLDKLGPKVAIPGSVRQDAEENRFLDQNREQRFARRDMDLQRRSTALATPGPTADERTRSMIAPLGRFGTEDASAAASELKTDPRGRLAQIEAQKDQLLHGLTGDVPRETSPIYTDAPRARAGDDTGTMPYRGGLAGLEGAEVPRAGIRQEFGGTAPDEVLSFSDRPQPGMRPYNSRSGTTKDVGAPGGGLSSVGGPGVPTDQRDALLAGLDELAGEARRQPLTPQEMAGALVRDEPVWDAKAAELGPTGVHDALNQAVADGSLDPKLAMNLGRKYAGIAEDIDQGDGPDPRDFAERLRMGRPPAPGEAQARLEAPSPIPQAQAAEQHAVQGALRAPQDGPGSTRSPALASAGGTNPDALLSEIQAPRGQSMTVPGVGGEVGYQTHAPFVPERMQQIPGAFRDTTAAAGQAAPPVGGEGEADLGVFADLPEELRLLLHGAAFAGGGHEPQAERKRRLAREAARRQG